MARTSPAPFAVTFTFPPPVLTSTVLLSSSACVLAICSCIFWACFINLFRFMVLASRRAGGLALTFLDYLSGEQADRFLNKRIFLEIFRSRTLRSQHLFGRKLLLYGELHTPVRSGDLIEQCFEIFTIGWRTQDIHHLFVETLLHEITGTDWSMKLAIKEELPSKQVLASEGSRPENFKEDPLIQEAIGLFTAQIIQKG